MRGLRCAGRGWCFGCRVAGYDRVAGYMNVCRPVLEPPYSLLLEPPYSTRASLLPTTRASLLRAKGAGACKASYTHPLLLYRCLR